MLVDTEMQSQMFQDAILAVYCIQKSMLGAQVLQFPHCMINNSLDIQNNIQRSQRTALFVAGNQQGKF